MNTIVDQNDLCRKYNYSSLITEEDNETAKKIIQQRIDEGIYFKNSPLYQTKENLFSRPEPVWLKLRMTFLTSAFLYLGNEARVSDMMAWSFMTNTETAEDRNMLWHHHDKHGGKTISGIYYLDIPEDVTDRNTCGTELAPNGPEGDGKFFITPSEYTWMIYPGETWHRPGIPQSKNWRFIIAADVQYT